MPPPTPLPADVAAHERWLIHGAQAAGTKSSAAYGTRVGTKSSVGHGAGMSYASASAPSVDNKQGRNSN